MCACARVSSFDVELPLRPVSNAALTWVGNKGAQIILVLFMLICPSSSSLQLDTVVPTSVLHTLSSIDTARTRTRHSHT